MPNHPQINLTNCIILQSRSGLSFIPPAFPIYFINSKRRFFLYFKNHRQMLQTMKIFTENNVRFYRRESMLPDRQEYEEQIFHCNYKYKKVDLRKNLQRGSIYNEPRLHFQRLEGPDRFKNNGLNRKDDAGRLTPNLKLQRQDIKQQMKEQQSPVDQSQQSLQWFNGFVLKNIKVKEILENKELITRIFLSEQ